MTGKCYLVGAGPGDPGLLTVKGRECLVKADVLIYDALSSAEFLHWLPKGCEKIFAGKRAADHALPQEGINALIVEKAKEGKTVVAVSPPYSSWLDFMLVFSPQGHAQRLGHYIQPKRPSRRSLAIHQKE